MQVSFTKNNFINVSPRSIKKGNKFSCIGWISDPVLDVNNSLILLAVADQSGVVLNNDASIKFEILKDGTDHRLRFMGSLSKPIAKTLQIRVEDKNWHFVAYLGSDNGQMSFCVDGLPLSPEDGVGPDGILYSTAYSRSSRLGGGDVWCPYLYVAGQSISLYGWRFGEGFTLDIGWLNQIMVRDRAALFTGAV